jgi:hypothetical protein
MEFQHRIIGGSVLNTTLDVTSALFPGCLIDYSCCYGLRVGLGEGVFRKLNSDVCTCS